MYSAIEIAQELKQPEPTPEQQAVIEAPPRGVYRVIAGAGSGKTETMAQRVVWLVANNHALPHEVLGLTFTRKAAGELGHRIAKRLGELHSKGMAGDIDEFQRPVVSTYNSFASSLYREHAVLLGLDPDAQVLTEASAWSLARSVVAKSTLPALAAWEYSLPELTRVVRLFAQRVSDNHINPQDLAAFVADFRTVKELPAGGRGQYADVDTWVETVSTLEPLLELVGEYSRAKKARGVIEFSDQVHLAAQLIASHPEVADQVRQTHQTVLLDEYQDTSVSQTRLLQAVFAGHPVMAVGDPHQAIYGWRGASSANLVEFDEAFGPDVTPFTLSTSWRNGHHILRAANHIAAPLRDLPGPAVGVLNPAPEASNRPLEVVFEETIDQEAHEVASWFASHLASTTTDPPSAALIVRQRTHQRAFVEALKARGVPVHVLGIGGLLDDPAIADIVCALRVIASPTAETELVRLLAGAKWRIGVADLHALSKVARWLQGRDEHGVSLPDDVRERLKESVSALDHAGLWDALAFVAKAPEGHSQRQSFLATTIERFVDAYQTLHALAQLRLTDVDELVHAIEHALGLDIEILAHPQHTRYLAARETFFEALHSYLAIADDASVHGFVQWLSEAERKDNLTPRAEPPEAGCVQVLTVHGAKGLEWDLVAIPRVVEDELPAAPRETKGWLYRGEVPYPFRGDAQSLPTLRWKEATTRKELVDIVEEFANEMREHRANEERRLMYVAITRAKHTVLLSGSFWAHQQKPRGPSPFLTELAEAAIIGPLPLAPENENPPERSTESSWVWPGDPLGHRRGDVEDAASAVRRALASRELSTTQVDGSPPEPHDEEVRRLALVRKQVGEGPVLETLRVPVRISASSLERIATRLEEYREAAARPLPSKPHRAALRGTLFHQYVESRLDAEGARPFVDVDGPRADAEDDELSLEQWKEAFEASEFAHLAPVAIEAELHMVVGRHILVCKMDAVFPTPDGVHIVDWKTGKPPTTPEEVAAKALQLGAYRLAWAQWKGLDPEQVTASFWFAPTRELVTPDQLATRGDLERILTEAFGA
jgi:DNA helicase II / ATP-dependent DNA helicase PcrA